jgi:hypothetical protein
MRDGELRGSFIIWVHSTNRKAVEMMVHVSGRICLVGVNSYFLVTALHILSFESLTCDLCCIVRDPTFASWRADQVQEAAPDLGKVVRQSVAASPESSTLHPLRPTRDQSVVPWRPPPTSSFNCLWPILFTHIHPPTPYLLVEHIACNIYYTFLHT